MIVVAIISLIVYSYALFCLVREMMFVETSLITEDHKDVHFSLLIYFLVSFGGFITWLFLHKDFNHGFYDHLIGESLWLLLFMFSIVITATTRHLKKERKGEHYHAHRGDLKF